MSVVNISIANLRKSRYTDLKDWLEKPENIYIGREVRYVEGAKKSKWSNPFSVKEFGRDACLEMYKNYVLGNKILMAELNTLEGKTLGCWCKPEKCNGDVLLGLLDREKKIN